MEMKFCQSCAMPIQEDEILGTNADGSKNGDYCTYCYKDGAFTHPTCTMEEMIEICVPHMTDMAPEAARGQMQQFFPTLKRWKA